MPPSRRKTTIRRTAKASTGKHAPNPFETASDEILLVYDPHGRVVHIHQITTFRGTKAPSAKDAEARALELARLHGHEARDLRVIKAPLNIDFSVPLRVDPKHPQSIQKVVQPE